MSSFCICKSYSHFISKNTCELGIVLTRTANILTTNQLIKLMMLWTTGPRALKHQSQQQQITFSNIFFLLLLFFKENKSWYFMWIICLFSLKNKFRMLSLYLFKMSLNHCLFNTLKKSSIISLQHLNQYDPGSRKWLVLLSIKYTYNYK